MYRAKLMINQLARNVYRQTPTGIYVAANKVIENCEMSPAHVQVFKRRGRGWREIDKQDVVAGNFIKC